MISEPVASAVEPVGRLKKFKYHFLVDILQSRQRVTIFFVKK